MGFLAVFMRVAGYIPAIVSTVEKLSSTDGRRGSRKQDKAIDMIGAALDIRNAIAAKDIVDAEGFNAGLKMSVDGIVAMLNASVWSKSKG
jgi:hypothetical protein